jgi:hypothetical protein
MATYYSIDATLYGRRPANTGHGSTGGTVHLHCVAEVNAGLIANDTIEFGYIPMNAVVVGAGLKADTQLDSNGSPTLALDLGVAGTPQLFKAAVTTVGHANGASVDNSITAAGFLWKNTTGADVQIVATAHAGAATGVGGQLELDLTYFVEDQGATLTG